MQEVEEIFNKNGFSAGPIQGTGKIYRFKVGSDDSGTSGFYIIYELKTESGDIAYCGRIGDWHNRDQDIEFNTLRSIKVSDRKLLDSTLKKIDRQFREEQETRWEETSKKTSEYWKMLPDGGSLSHPYLIRKQLNGYFGCKTELTQFGRNILVPLRDTKGKFWGYQRIQEDGKKFYVSGTKKLGNFHLIGEWGPKILVCEGFATAASLHLATDLPAVVGFDTSNLGEVAKEIKKAHPQSSLIICGDDDVFTPEEKGGNQGRKKAEEVAKSVIGVAIFPKFQSLESRPTDFNDLHCLEGLHAVKSQIDPTDGIKTFIKPLGTRGGGKFFYTSSHNKNICVLDAHTEADLLKLMPLVEHWAFHFPKPKVGVDWQEARATLMRECLEVGTFQSEKIRGVGVWMDQKRIVIHLGDRLLVDGRVVDIAFFRSQFHYELDVGFSSIHSLPLTVSECQRLRSICGMFSYIHIHQLIFLGGWIALAPICGALNWRPHIWLSGEAGSGKTTIKDFIDDILDSGFKRVSVTGGTTEAGIRQRLKASALPVIFDEFEPDGKKNMDRVLDTLDLMRQASSAQKGEILKGTQDQRGAAYQVSFMALVSSVKTSLLTEADRSRFTVIELEKKEPTSDGDAWKKIEGAMAEIDSEYAQRLVSRMIQMIPTILQNAKIAQQAFVRLGFSQRIGQQYGTLVAGWRALESDSVWSIDEAVNFCRHLNLKLESTVSQQGNPDDCLEWLLSYTVRFENREIAIRSLFHRKTTEPDHATMEKAREKFGISVRIKNGAVFLIRSNPHMNQIFTRDSKWTHAWFETLSRLPGVKKEGLRVHGRSCYGVLIPRELFHVEPSNLLEE